MSSGHLEAIKFENNELFILNQLLLPNEWKYEQIKCTEDAYNAIKLMKVRGAPAIALVAILSVAVEGKDLDRLQEHGHLRRPSKLDFKHYLHAVCDHLCSARPTAVNIRLESDALIHYFDDQLLQAQELNLDDAIVRIREYAKGLLKKDININQSIGKFGSEGILGLYPDIDKINVLTICNTGSLATAGYGTALETRPYLQGARLTASELLHDHIPAKMICDSMIALLMSKVKIHAVIVGVDRMAHNMDFANKIGTYQLAILAKHFDVPFFVACPLQTMDFDSEDGSKIEIEERPAKEIKYIGNVQIAPNEIDCWNPSFDVTPAEFITGGVVSETGFYPPNKFEVLQKIKGKVN